MSEFSFEGGTKGGPNFVEHLADRKAGLPRMNASLSSSYDPWPERHNQSTGAMGEPEPDSITIKVYRLTRHASRNVAGEGFLDEVTGDYAALWSRAGVGVRASASDHSIAEASLSYVLNVEWGGGIYRVVHERHGDYDLVVSGQSKPESPAAELGCAKNELRVYREGVFVGKITECTNTNVLLAPHSYNEATRAACSRAAIPMLRDSWGSGSYRLATFDGGNDFTLVVKGTARQEEVVTTGGRFGVGVTVWLELSHGGPYKVVGAYEQPLGASVPAHHPHDAPNTFEKVRVVEGLWLCQDGKGVVHILAEGSLTTTPPTSRFSRIGTAAAWCWTKRELVLWAALAGTVARLA